MASFLKDGKDMTSEELSRIILRKQVVIDKLASKLKAQKLVDQIYSDLE